jgi:hypothetical protein
MNTQMLEELFNSSKIKIGLVLFLIGFSQYLFSQQVVSTAGSTLSNANSSLTYTLGEPVSNTISNASISLTQGFIQPNVITTILRQNEDWTELISVYPNPATEYLKLKVDTEVFSGLYFFLYDMSGKIYFQIDITEKITDVPIQKLVEGAYILVVMNGDLELIAFKIIKK